MDVFVKSRERYTKIHFSFTPHWILWSKFFTSIFSNDLAIKLDFFPFLVLLPIYTFHGVIFFKFSSISTSVQYYPCYSITPKPRWTSHLVFCGYIKGGYQSLIQSVPINVRYSNNLTDIYTITANNINTAVQKIRKIDTIETADSFRHYRRNTNGADVQTHYITGRIIHSEIAISLQITMYFAP